jgi:hypothetical protein
MKLGLKDKAGLMEISKITTEGKNIIVTGTIMDSVPIRAVLTPEELRKALPMMSAKTMISALWIYLVR